MLSDKALFVAAVILCILIGSAVVLSDTPVPPEDEEMICIIPCDESF